MTNTNFKHWKSSNPDIIRLQHYQALINLISNFAIIRYSILLTDQESLMLVIDNFFLIGSTRRTRRRPVQIDNLLIEFQDGRKHLEFRGTGEYLSSNARRFHSSGSSSSSKFRTRTPLSPLLKSPQSSRFKVWATGLTKVLLLQGSSKDEKSSSDMFLDIGRSSVAILWKVHCTGIRILTVRKTAKHQRRMSRFIRRHNIR